MKATGARARGLPQPSHADRVRLAEAFRIGERLGNEVWRGWSQVPFVVLLVTPEHEFLVRHPRPSNDFAPVGRDDLLGSRVFVRNRTFPVNLQAAFPVAGIPTVVIGRPENTEAGTSTRWVLTLLHEHFHQMQDFQPGFFRELKGLGLARGDETGGWMLDFPFPYEEPRLNQELSILGRALHEALGAVGTREFRDRLSAYLRLRRRLRRILSPDDYRYLSLQIWLEGAARYTELRIATLAATRSGVSGDFRALPDFVPFEREAEALRADIMDALPALELRRSRRATFYPVGAAECLLLDAANPRWRKLYFTRKFYVEKCFQAGRGRSRDM